MAKRVVKLLALIGGYAICVVGGIVLFGGFWTFFAVLCYGVGIFFGVKYIVWFARKVRATRAARMRDLDV